MSEPFRYYSAAFMLQSWELVRLILRNVTMVDDLTNRTDHLRRETRYMSSFRDDRER